MCEVRGKDVFFMKQVSNIFLCIVVNISYLYLCKELSRRVEHHQASTQHNHTTWRNLVHKKCTHMVRILRMRASFARLGAATTKTLRKQHIAIQCFECILTSCVKWFLTISHVVNPSHSCELRHFAQQLQRLCTQAAHRNAMLWMYPYLCVKWFLAINEINKMSAACAHANCTCVYTQKHETNVKF